MRFELGLVKSMYPHNSRFDNAAIQPKNARQINWTTSCAKKSSPGQPHFFFSINSIESFYLKVKRSCLLRLEFTSKHFPQTVKRFLRHENIFQGSENFFEQHEIFNFVKKDLLNLKMLCQNFSRKTNILWISFEFKHIILRINDYGRDKF